MTEINQNFSVHTANDTLVLFDVGPDDQGLNLEFAEELTWKAYAQTGGIPDMTTTLIEKSVADGGIDVTDPLLLLFTVMLTHEDLTGFAGNYYHEVKIVADHGKIATLSTGMMTVIDPAATPNVMAFKAMFSDFEDVDDTLVQIALDAACRFVDESWGEMQAAASMYLAAHFLSMASSTADTSGQFITSESIGQISVSYGGSTATGTGSGTLGNTSYGTVFESMLTAQGYGIAIC